MLIKYEILSLVAVIVLRPVFVQLEGVRIHIIGKLSIVRYMTQHKRQADR